MVEERKNPPPDYTVERGATDNGGRGSVKRAISGYHRDEEDHWVAELVCGHFQHVRHNPPWTNRPWVITETGRDSRLGHELDCVKCDQGAPADVAIVDTRV